MNVKTIYPVRKLGRKETKMANVFSKHLGEPIPQTEQEDSRQVPNSAGGFTFVVNDKIRLERFLIIGTEGGTYYSDEKKLTKDNAKFVKELIERDEKLVIVTVRAVSVSGRAFRNSNAIFVVAALFAYGKVKPESLVTDVCRTATHLFEFAEYIQLLGGWGRSKRNAVANWYTSKSVNNLAYQTVKYRQRNGWTHQDLLRLSHPVGLDSTLVNFIANNSYVDNEPRIVTAFRAMQGHTTLANVLIDLGDNRGLPWEAIPTKFLKEPQVWKTLFYNGALQGQALVRNITRLARIGAFDDMVFAHDYATKLVDREMIEWTKLHPYQYLLAQSVHANGRWVKGVRVKDWQSNPAIMDALDAGFYAAFEYVEPANKRTMIALDVSGSMTWDVPGLDLTAAQVGAAMAMTIAKTEPYYQIMAFANSFRDLGIDPSMNLGQIMRQTSKNSFGATDCSLPMLHSLNNEIAVDTFIVITDNETWFGGMHPHKALQKYRQAMGIDAKLIVVGVTPTPFTIANPTDHGMLDVVGGDANLPKLITEFSAGRI